MLNEPQINLPRSTGDVELLGSLSDAGYEAIEFPGCTTDEKTYLSWRSRKNIQECGNVTTCEGFGITYRMRKIESSLLTSLVHFFGSEYFFSSCAKKFDVNYGLTFRDSGLHKYLDGYEISPHPDIRRKALTYMVNINPSGDSELINYHTQYMVFKDEFRYIQCYWEGNPMQDRCWVPWDWCNTVFRQTKNNSIIIFAPTNSSLHAIKASYDHLRTQRTQLYGNLWFHEIEIDSKPCWEDFIIKPTKERRHHTINR
ncbi:hypothetical protein H8F25_16425 [Synechococcus sp. CBW1004]|nr:hypothetical protein H8F25_16425 [Synechococcus sp. CBW1004]